MHIRPTQGRILDSALLDEYGCGARQHGIYQSKLTRQGERGIGDATSAIRCCRCLEITTLYHPNPVVPVRI